MNYVNSTLILYNVSIVVYTSQTQNFSMEKNANIHIILMLARTRLSKGRAGPGSADFS